MTTLKDLLGTEYKECMTTEEINNALANKSFIDRSTFDKTSNELANIKKLAKAKEAELKAKENESLTEMQKQAKLIEELQRENRISKLNNSLSKTFDAETAGKLAESLVNNEFNSVIETINKHKENWQKTAIETFKTEQMKNDKNTPPAPTNQSNGIEAELAAYNERIANAKDSVTRAALIRERAELEQKNETD